MATQEDRRRADDKNWEDVREFMKEQRSANEKSNLYRVADLVTQKYQAENLESMKVEFKKMNGRTFELEKYIEYLKQRIESRRETIEADASNLKDSNINKQQLILIIATIIMSVSAIVMAIPVVTKWFSK
jgi:hypothetical protein